MTQVQFARPTWLRRAAIGLTTGALAAGAGIMATPAFAAPATTDNASFSWTINNESGGGAYFGGCNYLVAGEVGDLGSSHVWTAEEGAEHYTAQSGNVTITKPDAEGNQVQPTWDTKCLDASGAAVRPAASSTSGNQVNLSNGAGTIDPDADSASIEWDGGFTFVYYGGLTYWSVSDLKLEIENGVGELTGVGSGYGADMNDTTQWNELPDTPITVATFSNLDVTETGFTVAPDYAGVEVELPAGNTPQNRTANGWGAFPQSWVDFNLLTGQSSYWYSSGGAADPKKVVHPFTVSYELAAVEPEPTDPVDPEPTETVDPTDPTEDPTDPTDPIETADPVEPAPDSTNPAENDDAVATPLPGAGEVEGNQSAPNGSNNNGGNGTTNAAKNDQNADKLAQTGMSEFATIGLVGAGIALLAGVVLTGLARRHALNEK